MWSVWGGDRVCEVCGEETGSVECVRRGRGVEYVCGGDWGVECVWRDRGVECVGRRLGAWGTI